MKHEYFNKPNPLYEAWDLSYKDGNGNYHRNAIYSMEFTVGGMHVYGTGVYLGTNVANDPMLCLVRKVGIDSLDNNIFEGDIIRLTYDGGTVDLTVQPEGVVEMPNGMHDMLVQWIPTHVGGFVHLEVVGSVFNKYLKNTGDALWPNKKETT